MRVVYDPTVDAAYIQLAEDIQAGAVDRTVLCDPNEVGIVNLDLDRDGRIVGIEVIGASHLLPLELLEGPSESAT